MGTGLAVRIPWGLDAGVGGVPKCLLCHKSGHAHWSRPNGTELPADGGHWVWRYQLWVGNTTFTQSLLRCLLPVTRAGGGRGDLCCEQLWYWGDLSRSCGHCECSQPLHLSAVSVAGRSSHGFSIDRWPFRDYFPAAFQFLFLLKSEQIQSYPGLGTSPLASTAVYRGRQPGSECLPEVKAARK